VKPLNTDGGVTYVFSFDTYTMFAKCPNIPLPPKWKLKRPGHSAIGPPTTVAERWHEYENEKGEGHNLDGLCFYDMDRTSAVMMIKGKTYDTFDEYTKAAAIVIEADSSLARPPGSKTKAARA